MEHISAYVLHDPSVDRSSEPCGLCLRPEPLCKIVLKKSKGKKGKLAIDMKASLCPNLVKFNLATAAQYTYSSPCTNHPILCLHCIGSESSPVVWSYNFRFHLLCKHPRVSLQDYNNVLSLTKLEKGGMKRAWEHCNKPQKLHQKSQCTPLMISERHHSHLVFKYVFLFYFFNNSTDQQNPQQ